jgi:putative transposase
MILAYRYRLLPTKQQHRALEAILESQRQLYNAALEERIDAYRKAHVTRTYFDQSKALTQWRNEDLEASALPVALQRATLKRLDEAYKGFFRRVKCGGKPAFHDSAARAGSIASDLRVSRGITMRAKLRFKGMPRALRIHLHRPMPADAS